MLLPPPLTCVVDLGNSPKGIWWAPHLYGALTGAMVGDALDLTAEVDCGRRHRRRLKGWGGGGMGAEGGL